VGGATGGAGTSGSPAIPGGFSRDAERIGDAWSNAVIGRCQCSPSSIEGCIAEDGVIVPSPFLLICLSQLAVTDPLIAEFLAQWATVAESDAADWRRCGNVGVPSVVELPPSALQCESRDFGCPEQTVGTVCDGIAQCINSEDEWYCGAIDDVFTCHRGEMLEWAWVCDGEMNCEFGEDERTCPALAPR
jgi:hypothetical protein